MTTTIRTKTDFPPDEGLGAVWTIGRHARGLPELCIVDVVPALKDLVAVVASSAGRRRGGAARHLLRAAVAAGARTAGARAEGGGGTRSSRGGGARGRIGSEERGAPECCGVSLHVTKFGGVT